MLGLLAVGLIALPRPAPPRLVTAAIVALAAYAGWSYLSIAWAVQKGDAWDGANRSALYALVFALFALWGARARPATALVAAYVLALAAVGTIDLLRAAAAHSPEGTYFLDGRFSAPVGYQNGAVALWFSAFWPAVALGSRRELRPPLRALLVAAAVVLAGLALLGQSRGWAYTTPLAAIAFLVLVRDRVRATLTLAIVVAATGAAAGPILHVYDVFGNGRLAPAVDSAARALLVAAAVAGAAAAALAAADRRVRVPRRQVRRAGAALAVLAAAAAAAAFVAWVAADGSPTSAVARSWHDFKRGSSPRAGSSRFGQSLGSNRYDFWRVAWREFEGHPIAGIGADNFQEAYLARRRSWEEPRYPHSVELRTLSQTGVVGALLLATAFACAFAAATRALRLRRGLGAATAAGAAAAVAYWLLHGSVDWLWEFPALGAPAFALLGIAAALAPRRLALAPRRRRRRRLLVLLPAAALAVSLALPWLATLESNAALGVWSTKPRLAFERLRRAAALDPLSPEPKLVAGAIALQLGARRDAERYFRAALRRDRGNEYATLELGLLEVSRRRAAATLELERAVALDPRDPIPRRALGDVERGRRVDVAAVNRALARRSIARSR